MSRIYIVLLAIAAILISGIGATFSIAGLTALFAGATFTVALMAGSLEFAKLVTAGFLYRYWYHVNPLMRTYLSATVVVLSLVTSMGIFGYLSNAYQRSTIGLKGQQLEIEAMKLEQNHIEEEITKTEKFINEVPASRISKKFALYEQSRNYIKKLRQQSRELARKIETSQLKVLSTQTEVGPIIYVAEVFHTKVDTIARILIFVFVSVFDPLAICLVFAFSLAVRIREKYRGNEARIGDYSISKPVDHRFKKFRKAA